MTDPRISAQLPDWIKDHLQRYLASNGEDGHLWDATLAGGTGLVPTLVLTTTGRKSGKPLTLPLKSKLTINWRVSNPSARVATARKSPRRRWASKPLMIPKNPAMVAPIKIANRKFPPARRVSAAAYAPSP